MNAFLLTASALVSTILFPWPLTVVLTLGAALLDPLTPIAVGLFADTLYYAPAANVFPLYTALGLVLSVGAFLVRTRLNTSSMGG